jgi:hypothetical protein
MSGRVENQESVDTRRLRRFRAGEQLDQIAESEGVRPRAVRSSIRRALADEQNLQSVKWREMKRHEEKEKARRQRVLMEHAPKVMRGIERRIEGKRTIVEVNKITGKVTKHTVTDIDTIAVGVRLAIRFTELWRHR